MIDLGDRVKVAYETFTGGFAEGKCPAPRWESAPTWLRDALAVAYLQGKLDALAVAYLQGKLDAKKQP
jgi:hypothetical protein